MKKYMFLIGLFFCTIVFAGQNSEWVLDKTFNPDLSDPRRATRLHRTNLTTNDTNVVSTDLLVDFTGFNQALCYVSKDSGTTATTWTLTPCFYDSTIGKVFVGSARTVISSDAYVVDVYGANKFFIRCNGVTGTTPKIKIWLKPLN